LEEYVLAGDSLLNLPSNSPAYLSVKNNGKSFTLNVIDIKLKITL
jgi:hypothetical protein